MFDHTSAVIATIEMPTCPCATAMWKGTTAARCSCSIFVGQYGDFNDALDCVVPTDAVTNRSCPTVDLALPLGSAPRREEPTIWRDVGDVR
jgi:hypothetical protein